MPKPTTTYHDFLQRREGSTSADMLNDSDHPFDALLDFSIWDDRPRPVSHRVLSGPSGLRRGSVRPRTTMAHR